MVGSFTGGSLLEATAVTLVGHRTNAASPSTNATAIGDRAQVDQDNSLVLGSIAGVNGAAANTRVGIGSTSPEGQLDVVQSEDSGPTIQATRFGPTQGARVVFRAARGTGAAPTALQNGNNLFELQASGHDGASFAVAAALLAEAAEGRSLRKARNGGS